MISVGSKNPRTLKIPTESLLPPKQVEFGYRLHVETAFFSLQRGQSSRRGAYERVCVCVFGSIQEGRKYKYFPPFPSTLTKTKTSFFGVAPAPSALGSPCIYLRDGGWQVAVLIRQCCLSYHPPRREQYKSAASIHPKGCPYPRIKRHRAISPLLHPQSLQLELVKTAYASQPQSFPPPLSNWRRGDSGYLWNPDAEAKLKFKANG